MDYNLDHLGWRPFEQLAQSLSAKVLGAGLVVFGDGPDGAREATFTGRVPYPSSENRWNGYIVVQAKYLQKASQHANPQNWLIQQIEDELEKIYQNENIRTPEYYILITNVRLTAQRGKGGRDRAEAKMNKWLKKLGIQNYSIWDYDKIRTLIDDNSDIRTAYAAWITPGDVIAHLIPEVFQEKGADFYNVLVDVIQKQLLADQYANLQQAGHATSNRTPLAHVFVDLPVSKKGQNRYIHDGRRAETYIVKQVIQCGNQKLNDEYAESKIGNKSFRDEDYRISSSGQSGNGKIVIVGGPGQGKTTVGQFIAQLYRASLLNGVDQSLLTQDSRDAISDLQAQCQREGVEEPTARRFPVRIVLNRLASFMSNQQISSSSAVLRYITEEFKRIRGEDVRMANVRSWLQVHPWLIILDGLDEVPSSSNRTDVLDAIRDFWVDVATNMSDAMVVATTRPQGYSHEFNPDIYQHYYLKPLSPEVALHYADRLVHHKHPTDQTRRDRIQTRLQQATRQGSTIRLMQAPLQVTILAALVDQMGTPPRERWKLFQEYYHVIMNREKERDIPAAEIIREHQPHIDAIHRHVGLILQLESEVTGGTDTRISVDRLRKVIKVRLSREGHEGGDLEALTEKMIEAAGQRLVFLVGLEAGEAGFEVRSLQEFMASEALIDGSDDDIFNRMETIAPVPNWRNVFIFASGHIYAARERMRDMFPRICSQQNDESEDKLGAILRDGSTLALGLLEDGLAVRSPKYAKRAY